MIENLVYLALGAPLLALLYVVFLTKRIFALPQGTEQMQRIARAIQQGAAAFLKTEYTYIAGFVAIVAVVLAVALGEAGPKTSASFVAGALLSALAGWIGMYVATRSAVRTTEAAKTSLANALAVAFGSGSVMGLCVVGLGLLGLTGLYFAFGRDEHAIKAVFGFSFGASSIALFARVGGGIFTKAADVGADLVGKVEAGIPEDDPRNPATIADNVGDNVGDVAGMGADLFESYVGSIIAAVALGYTTQAFAPEYRDALVAYPLVLSGVGILASIIGTFFVKTDDESKIHTALFNGLIVASLILLAAAFGLTKMMGLPISVFYVVASGLVAGVVIGKLTEYYTAGDKAPVQSIVSQTATGPATVLIQGLAVGMRSCGWPIMVVCASILVAYHFGGIYGIALAAVGMLSTLGISLGVDAYGPVADNAGGLAEMSHCDPSVRKRTDSLDAVGNTTAAIGKGFAIGSAALTALALLAAFSEEIVHVINRPEYADFVKTLNQAGHLWEIKDGKVVGMYFDVGNAQVLVGLLFGAMLPFLFSSMSMQAVGKAAGRMVEEVRRQFKTIPGLMEGKADPDYTTCVSISTRAAVGEMIVPGLLAVLSPVVVGLVLGPAALGGMLAGATVTGVLMAIMMANAGGAWDNAKKSIEAGQFGGKGSANHKAAVVGDTVGDPFKDTSGPSLNILIKLMCIVSVVFVPLFIKMMVR